MIAYLNGEYVGQGKEEIVIDVHGVGYRIFVSAATLAQLPEVGERVKVYTYQHVKEDAIALYGFLTPRAQELFRVLLSVSGVGPKLALTILAALSPSALEKAIATGDLQALTQISGVGKKTAQRLLLELKDKITPTLPDDTEALSTPPVLSDVTTEVITALVALGYSANEAEKAVQKIGEVTNVEVGIKKALKVLGRGI